VSDLRLKFKLQEHSAFDSTRNILAILQYRERRVIQREDIQEGFYNWLASGWTFDDDCPVFVDRARRLGNLVSPTRRRAAAGSSTAQICRNPRTHLVKQLFWFCIYPFLFKGGRW